MRFLAWVRVTVPLPSASFGIIPGTRPFLERDAGQWGRLSSPKAERAMFYFSADT